PRRGLPRRACVALCARGAMASGVEVRPGRVLHGTFQGIRRCGPGARRKQVQPGDSMTNDIHQFFRERGISEVEAIVPDMAGIARGKIMPAQKFAADEGMKLPESIFLQTVTGDYPSDTSSAMSPAEIDIVLKPDTRTV